MKPEPAQPWAREASCYRHLEERVGCPEIKSFQCSGGKGTMDFYRNVSGSKMELGWIIAL